MKNRQKCENWGTLTYFQNHTLYKNVYRPRKLRDHRTTTWSEHWTPSLCSASLDCRLVWVRCQFEPLQFLGFWEQMILKLKMFTNVFLKSSRWHEFTFCGQIWWQSAVGKLPKSHLVLATDKKLPLCGRGPSPAPILPPVGRSRPNFPERCRPLTTACVPNLIHSSTVRIIRILFCMIK